MILQAIEGQAQQPLVPRYAPSSRARLPCPCPWRCRLPAALHACCARPTLLPASLRSPSSAHHFPAPPCCQPCLLRQRWRSFFSRVPAAPHPRPSACTQLPQHYLLPILTLPLSPCPPCRLSALLSTRRPPASPLPSAFSRQELFWSLFCAVLCPSKKQRAVQKGRKQIKRSAGIIYPAPDLPSNCSLFMQRHMNYGLGTTLDKRPAAERAGGKPGAAQHDGSKSTAAKAVTSQPLPSAVRRVWFAAGPRIACFLLSSPSTTLLSSKYHFFPLPQLPSIS